LKTKIFFEKKENTNFVTIVFVFVQMCLWTEWAAQNSITRIFPTAFAGAETMWLESISSLNVSNMRARLAVVSGTFENLNTNARSAFSAMVNLFASDLVEEWRYNESVFHAHSENQRQFEAVFMMCDSLIPQSWLLFFFFFSHYFAL
jgi:hypothetical protein